MLQPEEAGRTAAKGERPRPRDVHARVAVRLLIACIGLAGCARGAPAPPIAASAPPAVASPLPVAVGDRAPAFALVATDGTPATLAPGKVNVLFFWATWSAPDKKSFPPIEALYEKRRAEGLTVLGVSVDEDAQGIPEFARTGGATFPVAWDRGHEVANRYAPASEPTYYVIDRSGIVRFVNGGWHDGDADELERQVQTLLGR